MYNNYSYVMLVLIIAIVQIFSIVVVYKYINKKVTGKITGKETTFVNIKKDKMSHLEYAIVYIIPLISLDINDIDVINDLYMNLIILYLVYVDYKSESFKQNILLNFMGYTVYVGEMDCNNKITSKLLIKKDNYRVLNKEQQQLKFVNLVDTNDVYININSNKTN